MKDFHDIWALSRAFAIDGPSLRAAIVACFDLRAIAWTPEVPDVLTVSFYQDAELQARWKSYLRSGGLRTPPNDRFEEIGSRVIGFLRPVRDAIVAGVPHAKLWPAGGPWT